MFALITFAIPSKGGKGRSNPFLSTAYSAWPTLIALA